MILYQPGFLCYWLLAWVGTAAGRSIHVDVQAPWSRNALSFISELSEFLHGQHESLFWRFTDGMCSIESSEKIQSISTLQRHLEELYSSKNDQDQQSIQEQEQLLQEAVTDLHSAVFELGASLIPASLHTLMYSMVGLGQYAPSVQFFHSMQAALLPDSSPLQCQDSSSLQQQQQRNAQQRGFVAVYRSAGKPGAVLCDPRSLLAHLAANSDLPEGIATPEITMQPGLSSSALKWDHRYTKQSSQQQQQAATGVRAVLYGMIGLPDFCQQFSALQQAAAAGSIDSFSVRHALPTAVPLPNRRSKTPLQGFGVFLDIKNMEYKNVDDSKSESEMQQTTDSSSSESASFGEDEEVLGVHFANLLRAHQETISKDDLSILREELRELEFQQTEESGSSGSSTATAAGDDSMKVWKMRDLGLQTLQSVHSAAGRSGVAAAMRLLADTASNFPKLASRISATKVSAPLREQVDQWYASGMAHLLPHDGVFVNGKFIDLSGSTFNVFNLLSNIRRELDITSKLSSLQLGTAAGKKKVLEIAQKVGKEEEEDEDSEGGFPMDPAAAMGKKAKFNKNAGPIRIDLSKGGKYVVNFFNNIEKDPQYQGMQRSLRQLLFPSWSIVPVGRNLYTLIGVVDPLSVSGANILLQEYMLMEQQYPVRFGAVFACIPSTAAAAVATAGSLNEDFCRLYAHLREQHSQFEATQFAISVASKVLEIAEAAATAGAATADVAVAEDGTALEAAAASATPLTRADLLSLYASSALEDDAAEAQLLSFSSSSSVGSPSRSEAEAVLSKAMHSDFVQNSTAYLEARGLPLNSYALNGVLKSEDNLSGSLMQMIAREQQLAAQLLRFRIISDKTKSLFGAILSNSRTYSRYHPMLEETTPEYVDFTEVEAASVLTTLQWIDTRQQQQPQQQQLEDALLSSSSVLYVPTTRSGFSAAAAALQFVLDNAVKQKQQPSATDTADDIVIGERVALVLDNSSSGSSSGNDVVVLAEEMFSALRSVTASEEWFLHVAQMQKLFQLLSTGAAVEEAVTLILEGLDESSSTATSAVNTERTTAVTDTATTDAVNVDARSFLKSRLRSYGERVDSLAAAAANRLRAFKSLLPLTSSPSDGQIVLIHNGRKLVINAAADSDTRSHGKAALFAEDLELLAALERSRIGNKLLQNWQLLQSSAATTTATVAAVDPSDQLLRISSYCGKYSSTGGSNRLDVKRYLSMLGMVPPPAATATATAGDDQEATDAAVGSSSSRLLYTLEPDASTVAQGNEALEIYYLVDPLSVAGQRAAALIGFVHEHLQYSQHIVLIPRRDIAEFPLQNFYRFVVSPEEAIMIEKSTTTTKTTSTAATTTAASARFESLPRQHTLTVRMDTPEPWNVQSAAAMQDIDNLRCTAKLCGDSAAGAAAALELTAVSYALKTVLVAGQCFESAAASGRVSLPPTGLQLTLQPAKRYQFEYQQLQQHQQQLLNASSQVAVFEHSDTLVMQNLGYYQLQANPGLYVLNLAAGRATELYTIGDFDAATATTAAAASGTTADAVAATEGMLQGGQLIAVRSFEDEIHRLVVHKRAGKEQQSLLEDAGDDDDGIKKYGKRSAKAQSKKEEKAATAAAASKSKGGVWNSLFGSSSSSSSESADKAAAASRRQLAAHSEDDDRIHVFSLATGHVYERLLRIMMLSVTRHSSKPVKFWLFENYLSPTFKQSASAMAQEFGFEVGYVTYKWPQWLTQQTQQQRIIWGYKILFLDVLFPLGVKKVIYVDADQVVRADLKELWEMDLQGKPYAYTPFCTSRQETLGFQFWRQGYWKDHLRGLPYHISALYVVDLQKFRRNAIGDTLRATYDRLSRDPNSLANLDQDLPNFAQHQVPIFSLPQEWLWCESWCSDETKSSAKTIDLCNNPMYKEPKLDMARRVISGSLFNNSWVELDEEIKALQHREGLLSLSNE